jgi:uncharacterized protein
VSLVEAWIADLRHTLEGEPQAARDVRIGAFYTAVQLSSGGVGVAFTTRELGKAVCCPKTAASAPPAGRMAGQDAWALAEYALSPVPLRRSVGIATLNALSTLTVERYGTPGGQMVRDLDALDAAEVSAQDTVAMVGAFVPFIKKLKGNVAALWIIDKHRDALNADEQAFWRPAEDAGRVLSAVNIVIISGSALVEGGIDELIDSARGARKRILAGPTTPLWPPPFFEAGIDVLAGVRILDGARMLTVVSEGGSGYYFFDQIAEKVCVLRQSEPAHCHA